MAFNLQPQQLKQLCLDRGGCDAAIDVTPDLALGNESEEALDLVDPGGVGVRWTCQRGGLASQLRISGILWVA
jgi:hypothetical protein